MRISHGGIFIILFQFDFRLESGTKTAGFEPKTTLLMKILKTKLIFVHDFIFLDKFSGNCSQNVCKYQF